MRPWSRETRRSFLCFCMGLALFAMPQIARSQDSSLSDNDILKQVIQRGTLLVGECMGLAPYAMYNASNTPEGYNIDIANRLGESLGVEVEIVNLDPAARIPSLQTGKVDVVICDTTRTLDRMKQVAFTNTYNVAGSVILSNKGSGINSLEDLNGKTVAIAKGTPYGDVVGTAAPEAEIIYFNAPSDLITAVKAGQASAAIESSGFLNYKASLDPGLEVTNKSVIGLYYNSFAVPQGQPNWLAYLNEFIFELNTSGENAALYKKWFGVTPPFPLNPSF
jgi:polar amino acid transport system substrate-binding protein